MATELFTGSHMQLDPEFLSLSRRLAAATSLLKSRGVSFDMDGVEVDIQQRGIVELNRRLGTNYKLADITTYRAFEDFVRLRSEIADPVAYTQDIYHCDFVLRGADPMPGATILSAYLHRKGVEALRITSRSSDVAEGTFAWYAKWMPWVGPALIHIQKDGGQISAGFKVQKIRETGVGYHFEDSWEQAEQIVEETSATVILVPQPWNEDYFPRSKRIIKPSGDELPALFQSFFALVYSI